MGGYVALNITTRMLARACELTYSAYSIVVLIAECHISFCTVLTSTLCISHWLPQNRLRS